MLAFCNHEDSLELSRQQEPDLMTSYADADLAGDISTRRSTTGVCVLLNRGLVGVDQQIAAYGSFKYDRGGDDRYHGAVTAYRAFGVQKYQE